MSHSEFMLGCMKCTELPENEGHFNQIGNENVEIRPIKAEFGCLGVVFK